MRSKQRASDWVVFLTFVGAFCVASPASAILQASISTDFPANVTIGQMFDASLIIMNTSTDAESGDTAILTDIKLIPSCANVNVSGTACLQIDTGVFSITNIVPGPGEFDPPFLFPANVCDLTTSGGLNIVQNANGFTINTVNEVDIGVVGHSNLCRIDFKVTVLATPAHDADPATAGIQTRQLATVDLEGYDLQGTATASGVSTTTFAARPLFVIGDVEPHAVGNVVNFWGSQWWKNNDMSGFVNAGYPAFKGYASDADNFCGGMWETRPGNSSNPPDVIPDFVLVIVTDTVHKDGPDITGTIKQIVLVHSDGKYGPAPGHRGNGPVTQIICTDHN